MSENKVYLTNEGFLEIEEELNELKSKLNNELHINKSNNGL